MSTDDTVDCSLRRGCIKYARAGLRSRARSVFTHRCMLSIKSVSHTPSSSGHRVVKWACSCFSVGVTEFPVILRVLDALITLRFQDGAVQLSFPYILDLHVSWRFPTIDMVAQNPKQKIKPIRHAATNKQKRAHEKTKSIITLALIATKYIKNHCSSAWCDIVEPRGKNPETQSCHDMSLA
jgi:hypothetical protein